MAVTFGVSLQSVLGTLTGSTNVSTFTGTNALVTGTISVVGDDVLIYSPSTLPVLNRSTVIPFGSIDRVIAP